MYLSCKFFPDIWGQKTSTLKRLDLLQVLRHIVGPLLYELWATHGRSLHHLQPRVVFYKLRDGHVHTTALQMVVSILDTLRGIIQWSWNVKMILCNVFTLSKNTLWWILFWRTWILLNLERVKVRSLKVVYPAEMQVKNPCKNQSFRKIHNIYTSQPATFSPWRRPRLASSTYATSPWRTKLASWSISVRRPRL